VLSTRDALLLLYKGAFNDNFLQRLSWDGFWRFARDLDLGLSDAEIAKLRQQGDKDMDGFVDWNEMVDVFRPLLVIKLCHHVANHHSQ
jgi:hypothetical protein